MDYYASATLILVVLMVTMIIHVLNYSGFNKTQKTWFVLTFSAITFCALAEYSLHCGYFDPMFKIPLTILTVLQFAIAPCFAMLFAGALGLKNQKLAVLISLGICLTIGIICAPFGWVFYIDDAGYHRGPAFFIYEITYFGSLVYIIGSLIVIGKKFAHRDLGTIIMILIIIAAGIVPMTIFQLHVAYIAVGVSSVICYIFYNDLVQQETRQKLLSQQQKVMEMQTQISSRLANLIESRDTETGQHVARTSMYVKTLAEDCLKEGVYADQINDKYIEDLFRFAPLHDVGKILVSDKILLKPAKLTPEEFEEIKKHTINGSKVLRQILNGIANEEETRFAEDIVKYHHEKWDGKGYPEELKEEEIPLSARIMAVADVFDALVSKRCYKEAFSFKESFKIIKEESGTHFDPKLVEVFLKHKDEFVTIAKTIVDPTTK